jgi:molybdopterin converting factor small subunit
MRVEIGLCSILRPLCDGPVGTLDVAEGATLGEAIGSLEFPPGLSWIAVVNARPAGLDTRLVEGDSVYLFVPVSGG